MAEPALDTFPTDLRPLAEKVLSGGRLDAADAAVAFTTPNVLQLGRLANFVNGELLGRIVAMPGEASPWWTVKYPQELLEGHAPALSPEQAIALVGQNYFTGFHEECDGDFTIRLTRNTISSGARDTTWMPAFDRFWGVRGLDGDGSVLAAAGDFTNVAGVPAQGLALFRIQPPEPPPPPGPVQLPMGSTWRYLDGGVEVPGWTDPAFDDSAWASGPAELGYGDGDDVEIVLVEVKTGRAKLTPDERRIQDAVAAGRVRFEVVRL